jgi:hypothetical protein
MRYVRSMWEHREVMSAIVHNCAACGTGLPVGARFCASCGARISPVGGPVSWSVAERRYFGVVPGATLAAAVRTRAVRLWAALSSRIRLAFAVADSRVRAWLAQLPLRFHLRRLEQERARELHALGDAVYRDDRDQSARTRKRVGAVDSRVAAVNAELERVARVEGERIAQARLEGNPTSIVEPPPPGAPEPPIVPEPEPVPHEPPGPVIVPEPEPVPHEPPGPVIVPEPDPRRPPPPSEPPEP